MWLLWSRRIVAFKLYFCSHKQVSRGFSLYVGDCRRFWRNCFQPGLIIYQTPMFYQYLFRIFNYRVKRCEKKANTSWPFGLCIYVRADCLKAMLTPESDLSLFSGYLLTLRSCLSFKRPSSGVFFWRVSSKQSYCVAFNETIFYAWWVARGEVHKLEGLGRLVMGSDYLSYL